MTGEGFSFLLVRLRGGVKSPDLDEVVAATSDEATVTGGGRTRGAADNAARSGRGSPRDGVDPEAVGREGGVVKC